jgi:hypothetical protein
MSELHSETNDSLLGLIVRVKLVDLNHSSQRSRERAKRGSLEQVSEECLSAIVGLRGERSGRSVPTGPEILSPIDTSAGEICMLTGVRVRSAEFENHIESCSICANRVELQLDFMEALEIAVCQRKAEPASEKVRGAMLISSPELNFAVCGELEIG